MGDPSGKEPEAITPFKALCLIFFDEYRSVYLDAMVLVVMLRKLGVEGIEEKANLLRSDPVLVQEVESRFDPLRKLLTQVKDDKDVLEALQKLQTKSWLM